MNFLVSTAYLPPIPYFSLLWSDFPVFIDQKENFQKQSFRNRAHILSPQGVLTLSVPIQKISRRGTPIQDVKISTEFNWQRLHWMSLQSCYRRSTYFEYYEDEIVGFFEKSYTYIYDLNRDWMDFIGRCYGISPEQNFKSVEVYQKIPDLNWIDLRDKIHPKKNLGMKGDSYAQVFSREGQFSEDISILDLLFNLGKQGIPYLKKLLPIAEMAYGMQEI